MACSGCWSPPAGRLPSLRSPRRHPMKRLSAVAGVLAVAIVAIVIAAAASGGSTATPGPGGVSAARAGATVIQGQGSHLGRLLTDRHGRVLYLFEADTP